jgi:MFS family permease
MLDDTTANRPPAPAKKAGAGFIAAYSFAYLGVWMAALTPIIVTLPMRVRQIDPQNYVADLSGILAAGALLAMLANPFFGRLSDRTTSRFGMRRPWLLVGAGAGFIGFGIIAFVPTIPAIALGWCLAQISVNILLAITTALLPDQIPAEQRGRVSGYLSMCMTVAPTVGAFLAKRFVETPALMFFAPAIVMALGAVILALVMKDRHQSPGSVPPYSVNDFFRSFWVDWLKHSDFSWIWLSRFLRFFSLALLMSYQAYFVSDHLGMNREQTSAIIVMSTIINAVMGVIGANAAGMLSDFFKRRKTLLTLASLTYATGLVTLAFANSELLFYIAIGFTGIGHGAFIALDFAVVSEVLPDAETSSAKNLGVFNMANALPQSIAPALAPMLLGLGGGNNYTALFLAAGMTSIVAGFLVQLIKKVR